jgi:hypothetical protein
MTQDKQFFRMTSNPIEVNNHDNRIRADIFENEIFGAATHSIHSNIQPGNPKFLTVDLILIHIFIRPGMIVSGDDFKCSIGEDHRIDASSGTADTSADHLGHTSRNAIASDKTTRPVFDGSVIMHFIHK